MKAHASAANEIEAGGASHGKIARGDQEAAGDLSKGSNLFAAGEIPLKHDWIRAEAVRNAIVRAESAVAMKGWINGNNVSCPLEVTAYPTLTYFGRQNLADTSANYEEVELRRVATIGIGSEAGEHAELPRLASQ